MFVARSHYDHEGVAISRLFVSSPRDYFPPLFGEPGPSLHMLKGRVTCGVLVGLGLVYPFSQINLSEVRDNFFKNNEAHRAKKYISKALEQMTSYSKKI